MCVSVCLSRTSCVSCLHWLLRVPWELLLSRVGLGCSVLSCSGVLSCVVTSACRKSVLSLCRVYFSSRSLFGFPFLCSFIRPRRLMLKFFHPRTHIKAQQQTFERFRPQHHQSCQKNTLSELEMHQRTCHLTTPICDRLQHPCRMLLTSLSVAMMHQIVQKHSKQ